MKLGILFIIIQFISYHAHGQHYIIKTKRNNPTSKPYLEAKKEADFAYKNGKFDLASAYYKTAASYFGSSKEERKYFEDQLLKSAKLWDLHLDLLNAKARNKPEEEIKRIIWAIVAINPRDPTIIKLVGKKTIEVEAGPTRKPIIIPNYLSIAISKYTDCRFWASAQNLRKATIDKGKPISGKLKKQLLIEFDILLAYQSDINKIKENESQQSGLNEAYKNIIRKLADINKIDSRFLPCLNYKKYYDEYLIEQINKGKTCLFITPYLNALEILNILEFNKIEIKNKKKELCEIIIKEDICPKKISELISIFKRTEDSYKNCQLVEAKNYLELTKNYSLNFPDTCKLPINKAKIDSLQILIEKSSKQDKLLSEIKELFFQNRCLLAYEKSLTIDSTEYCKKSLNLAQIKCCAFRELIDSASRARRMNLYRDCQRFSNMAFTLACSKTDSAVATTLNKDCKCLIDPENKICKQEPCDSLKIYSKSFYIGAGLNNISNNLIGKETSFLFGFRNYNLKPLKHFSIGHFEELSINTPDVKYYHEFSSGLLGNYILNRRICNNNPLAVGTIAISASYPFNFSNVLLTNNYFTNISNAQRIQLKVEPQITFRFKNGLFGIGYQKTVFENKVKLNNESIKFRLGLVF